MNDIQRLFFQTKNLAPIQPAKTPNYLGRTYIVYLTDDQRPAASIQQQPTQNPLGGALLGFGLGIVLGGAVLGIAEILDELFSPVRNDEPLTASMKRYIRERDGEICLYCEDYAPDGHVDHRVSRDNGGGNEPENLTWACAFCNRSKGAKNDTDYFRLLQAGY